MKKNALDLNNARNRSKHKFYLGLSDSFFLILFFSAWFIQSVGSEAWLGKRNLWRSTSEGKKGTQSKIGLCLSYFYNSLWSKERLVILLSLDGICFFACFWCSFAAFRRLAHDPNKAAKKVRKEERKAQKQGGREWFPGLPFLLPLSFHAGRFSFFPLAAKNPETRFAKPETEETSSFAASFLVARHFYVVAAEAAATATATVEDKLFLSSCVTKLGLLPPSSAPARMAWWGRGREEKKRSLARTRTQKKNTKVEKNIESHCRKSKQSTSRNSQLHWDRKSGDKNIKISNFFVRLVFFFFSLCPSLSGYEGRKEEELKKFRGKFADRCSCFFFFFLLLLLLPFSRERAGLTLHSTPFFPSFHWRTVRFRTKSTKRGKRKRRGFFRQLSFLLSAAALQCRKERPLLLILGWVLAVDFYLARKFHEVSVQLGGIIDFIVWIFWECFMYLFLLPLGFLSLSFLLSCEALPAISRKEEEADP